MLWRPVQRRLSLAWTHPEVVRCRPSPPRPPIGATRQLSSASTNFPNFSQFNRSDFTSQPFTGSYETGLPTSGPLGSTPAFGAPRITPKVLKQYLDQYVVGQERAKKILSVAVYNHYQRTQELQRREEETEVASSKRQRREALESLPLEDDLPGQKRAAGLPSTAKSSRATPLDQIELVDSSPLQLEKSNILLVGPSGVGKTLMAKTLARVLSVPFSISDCTPFTQAGYIGEDVETCIHRLLAAANYNVEQAERGIIVLDEVDKIAGAKVSHGKDVSGEGVQQALLKIIEGTTVQVQAKPEKNPRSNSPPNSYPSNSPLGNTPFQPNNNNNPAAKGDVYSVRTDNILFICSGAFGGLDKVVLDRISRKSMGFDQPLRSGTAPAERSDPSDTSQSEPLPILPGSEEEALYKKHIPFYLEVQTPADRTTDPVYFNPLDLLSPQDLSKYGFIQEFIGRIPVTAALSTLTTPLLLRILTEPRNSLLAQYTTLFSLSGIELRFTTPALQKVAANAFKMGTGARAIRTEMETILSDAMYEAPGSSVKFVLVTESVSERKEKPIYLARGQGGKFHAMISAEESQWEEKTRREKSAKERKKAKGDSADGSHHTSNFQEYRKRAVG